MQVALLLICYMHIENASTSLGDGTPSDPRTLKSASRISSRRIDLLAVPWCSLPRCMQATRHHTAWPVSMQHAACSMCRACAAQHYAVYQTDATHPQRTCFLVDHDLYAYKTPMNPVVHKITVAMNVIPMAAVTATATTAQYNKQYKRRCRHGSHARVEQHQKMNGKQLARYPRSVQLYGRVQTCQTRGPC